MKKDAPQLKCSCVHCGQAIDYSVEEVGKIAKCPNCKEQSLLPPPFKSPKQGTRSDRLPSNSLRWVVVGAAGLLALAALVFLPPLRHQWLTPTTVDVQPLPAALPQPMVKLPKSLNDLKIGRFSLEPLPGTDSRIAAGDIQNVSETLHRGIKVELELRDAQGLKVGSLDAFINELAPHATWHVLARTADPRAASVRVAGIKEEP